MFDRTVISMALHIASLDAPEVRQQCVQRSGCIIEFKVVLLRTSGAVIAIAAILQDATERWKREKKLAIDWQQRKGRRRHPFDRWVVRTR